MDFSKQLLIGIFIGILIGVSIFYVFAQFSQIANLQSQISQLQNENSQLKANNTALLNEIQQLQLGDGGSFTRFEKIEFISGYATIDSTNSSQFNLAISLKNTGSADATIDMVFLNGRPAEDFWTSVVTQTAADIFGSALTMAPGDTKNGTITLTKGSTWASGMSVEAMIQTVAGRQYPKTINLP